MVGRLLTIERMVLKTIFTAYVLSVMSSDDDAISTYFL